MKLIYINKVGMSWNSGRVYEFLFSDSEDVDGENWDRIPAGGNPEPPKSTYVKKVGKLNTDLVFDLIQDSDTFAMWDAVDGLISLGWENIDEYEQYPDSRIHFSFGDELDVVVEKLLTKDNTLVFSNDTIKIEQDESN